MEIRIFDVSHGFCALLIADNGNVMLFDCGHNEGTGFRPSEYLWSIGCRGIEQLIVQNFDQDHVSDLPSIRERFPVTLFIRNRSITVGELEGVKAEAGPITEAMEEAIEMHRSYVHSVEPPLFPGIEFATYSNRYPDFEDTNNLSLVSFVHYDDMGIVFPGDLEEAGWEALLQFPEFREHLGRISIFVASHHGRVSGFCGDVFRHCTPDIVVISDKEIVYETQKQLYADHAAGIYFGGSQLRKVLTTRSDGMVTISKTMGQPYSIHLA